MTQPWYEAAACRESDPELWYPAHGEYNRAKIARKICARCDVQAECLQDVLAYEATIPLQYKWGIHAGLDARERHALALGYDSPYHGTVRGWREHLENGQDPCMKCENAADSARKRRETRET